MFISRFPFDLLFFYIFPLYFRNENPLDIPRAWAEKERKVVSCCSVRVSVKAGGCEKLQIKDKDKDNYKSVSCCCGPAPVSRH